MHKKQSVDRATLHLFWEAYMQQKPQMALAVFYSLSAVCMNTIIPLIIGKILAALLIPHSRPLSYVPWLIVVAVVAALGNWIGFNALMRVQANGAKYLHYRALEVLLRRSVGFHNDNVSGKLVSDVLDLPQASLQITSALFINLMPFLCVLLIGSVIVFSQSWELGLVIVIMSVFTVGSGLLDRRSRKDLRMQQIAAGKDAAAHTGDAIVNIQTVKTFAREEAELDQAARLTGRFRDLRLTNWLLASRRGSYRIAILLTMQIGLVLAIVHAVQRDPSLLSLGIFAFSFTILLSTRLFDINSLLRNVDEAMLHASPMVNIMLQQPEILDAPGAKKLKVRRGEIALKNVTFQYNDTNHEDSVFDKLDLRIAPGEKIGLVGPSGGGKSTLTRLLLRFEDISGGEILIDGQNIALVTQQSLRQAIAYVPQEPLLFHRSIRENIAYGESNISDKQIKAAAHSAHADEFISELPKGYDTIVGERGVKLSGGQRQRVAIARALLKNAPILILDEATSALDSESEVLIQDALWRLMEKRTAIVIAHRLSTIQKMDRIIVLNNGKIVEEGTHKQLLRAKGMYAKLWAHQSGGFLEDNQ